MQLLQQSETTASERRVFLSLVDAADGMTPEVGEGSGQPQLSKNGGSFVNTSATLVHVGQGCYYVELSASELDTPGIITVRYKSANTTERQVHAQVIPWDPYDSTRLGLTTLPNASPAASGGLLTLGTGAGQINVDGNGNVKADLARWMTGTPNALVSGRVDASVGVLANNVITAAAINNAALTASKFSAGAIDAAALASDAVAEIADAVWDENLVSAHSSADTAGLILSQLTRRSVTLSSAVADQSVIGQMLDDGSAVFDRSTDSLQATRDAAVANITIGGAVADVSPNATEFEIAGVGISVSDGFYFGCKLAFTSGVNKGVSRTIQGYTGATKRCNFAGNIFPAAPANGDSFEIYGG